MHNEIVPATMSDFTDVYGGSPPRSFHGFAARVNGKAVAICGLYQADGLMVAFSQVKPPVPKRAAALLCRRLLDLMRAKRVNVFALRDAALPTSATLLSHLGFERLAVADDGEVYQWRG